jgi:NAD(P)-dependent dehydrogenase (short-subunit alcohol dehydrogenase family)
MPTYLITGANRGIGLELTRQLTTRGDTVIGAARDPDGASDLRTLTDRVEQLDTADEDSILALADRLAAEPIDVLINNAGVFLDGRAQSSEGTTAQQMLDTYRVNVVGPFLLTRALAPNLERGQRKLAIQTSSNLGSISAAIRERRTGWTAYCASKAALNMVSVLMDNELRSRGVASVAIHPGWVKTDMGGEGADLERTDAAAMIIKTIDSLTPEGDRRFVRYDGEPMDW